MSTKRIPSYLFSATGKVTVYDNGKVYTADPSHANYAKIKEAVRKKQWKGLADLFNVSAAITRKGKGKLEVKNGQVLYNKKPVHNVVVDRIFQFMQEGLDFKPLLNFLKNLLQNPSDNSVQMLYKFIEANDLPITWDGYFLAYKKVKTNYKDFYSGTFDNSPGQTVKMPREEVVEDPNQACHRGLHVGGLGYARDSFNAGLGKLMVVKVHPANVVSVPNDYSHGKCRTCEYSVLREMEDPTRQLKQVDSSSYVPEREGESSDYYEDEDDYCEDCGKLVDECSCAEDENE